MLSTVFVPLLNRFLTPEDWARGRLRPFVGQVAELAIGDRRVLRVEVTADGLFTMAQPEGVASVIINLPADALAQGLVDRTALFSAAKISGSADFAETLAFVFRNFRWDITDGLSLLVGDIVARRLGQWAGQFGRFHLAGAQRLTQGLVAYLTEEQPIIASHRDLEHYYRQVDGLRDDVARLQKKIERLERR
ncbi:MAG TPA: hypothetical protein PKN13_05320 [Accumulibacter sp.]|nr:hypothetical protein [Accumulibacter sp.]HMW17628.1 hypothetical protein [Accumulibacter sp.]HMX21738.1 hypothetical protein [Accumulibacter sp.]HMY05508.1 hypothetical protein [Accumulibacter sp.]HNC18301.1 hypothetical protein [Accumulibacter sp.]